MYFFAQGFQFIGMIWYLPYAPDFPVPRGVFAPGLDLTDGVQESIDLQGMRLGAGGAWIDVTGLLPGRRR